jgi:hypothetical protein
MLSISLVPYASAVRYPRAPFRMEMEGDHLI